MWKPTPHASLFRSLFQRGEILDEVADLAFGEDLIHGWHGGDDGGSFFHVAGFDFGYFTFGIADSEEVIFFALEKSGDCFAVLEGDGDGAVSLGDFFLRVNDGLEEVASFFAGRLILD